MGRILLLLSVLCWSLPAFAVPRVVASIPPVHSLVSGVMDGVAEPQLLIGGGASPHDYALKPSDARALSEADLIVWVGEGLETVLEKPLRAFAGGTPVLELSTLKGMHLLPIREGGVWEAHAAGEDAPGDSGGHGHGEMDPHLWLAPDNARRIVAAVAQTLSQLDPVHAARYRANAASTEQRIAELEMAIEQELSPVRERRYIVFHDAYHYFEEAFGLHPAGAIAISPERLPGARRIADIRRKVRNSGVACVFSEPQFRPAIVDVVLEGSNARKGVLDPLGAGLPPGKGQWFALMRELADNLVGCLAADAGMR